MAAEAPSIAAINPSSLHIVYLWHDAGIFLRFSVTPAAHANILQLISPLEEGTVDRNDPHRLTGFQFFDEEDQMQYIVEGFCCEEASLLCPVCLCGKRPRSARKG